MAKLNKLSLKNYRDLKRLKFPLEHPSLLILGANGSGKTQLLHSLLLYFRAYNIHCVHDQNVRRTPSGDLHQTLTLHPKYNHYYLNFRRKKN